MPAKSTKAEKTPTTPARTLPKRGATAKAGTSPAEQQEDSSPVRGTLGSSQSRSRASTSSDLTDLSDTGDADDAGVSRDVDMHRQSSPTRGATSPSQSYGQLFSPAHSRVGTTIARPNYSTGIRTYGRKRSLRPASELPQTPEAGPSRLSTTPNSSPLTPLTPTPSPTKRKGIFSQLSSSTPSPSKRKRIVNDELVGDSISTFHETPSKRRTLASKHPVTPSPRRKLAQADASIQLNSSPRIKQEPSIPDDWSLDSLGTLVWVRIDKDNVLSENPAKVTYWWPAKLDANSPSDGSLRATLLCPPSVSNPAKIDIPNPSRTNIVSQTDNLAKLRFDSDTFRVGPSPNSASSSPRKKHLGDLHSRWQAARSHMIEEDEVLNDGFPSSITAVFSHISDTNSDQRSGKVPSLNLSARKGSAKGKSAVNSHAVNWSPPPPDITINIPGEVVFSKEKKSKDVYWPARVDAYLPPSGPDEKPRYQLTFLDNSVLEVTRDMFLIYDQEQFGTCRLGKFESKDTLDDGEILDKIDYEDFLHPDPAFRIPEPSLPPPPPEVFYQLPMIEQLAFVIPILSKVVECSYTPANARNNEFLRGGKNRAKLSYQVLKGLLTNLELLELQKALFQWAGQIVVAFSKRLKSEGERPSAPAAEVVAIALSTAPVGESSINEQADVPSNDINDRGNDELLLTSDMDFSASSPTRDHGMDDSTLVPTSPIQLPPPSLPPSSIISEAQEADVDIDDPTSREASANPADQSPRLNVGSPLLESNSQVRALNFLFEEAGDNVSYLSIWGTNHQQNASDVKETKPVLSRSFFVHLADSDRVHYITNVLLPEAIIQLLLWRSGGRTSLQPLSDGEETEIYKHGCELTRETDFVFSAMQLRKSKEQEIRGIGLHSNRKDQTVGRLGGSRSRPRMVHN